jgi:hypothetical protein
MQSAYLAAGIVAILTGIAHSVIGEYLIFRPLRDGGLVPSKPAPPLAERRIRILWASWHIVSVFGWAFAAILLRLAVTPQADVTAFVLDAIVGANLAGSALVLVGTRGRHPGWIALLVIAALVAYG